MASDSDAAEFVSMRGSARAATHEAPVEPSTFFSMSIILRITIVIIIIIKAWFYLGLLLGCHDGIDECELSCACPPYRKGTSAKCHFRARTQKVEVHRREAQISFDNGEDDDGGNDDDDFEMMMMMMMMAMMIMMVMIDDGGNDDDDFEMMMMLMMIMMVMMVMVIRR